MKNFTTILLAAVLTAAAALAAGEAPLDGCPGDASRVAPATPATPAAPAAPAAPVAPAESVASSETSAAAPAAAAALEAYRLDLLRTAFEVASALPAAPHIKTRCRKQEDVVLAALRLDQPELAEAMIPAIDNWRQGSCWAALAYHEVRTGRRTDVQAMLQRAEKFAAAADQDWRRDRVRVKIAMTEALLGREDRARTLGADVDDSQAAQLEAVLALRDETAFAAQLARLDQHIAGEVFDLKKNALKSCVLLYRHFYADAQRRELLDARLRAGMADLPAVVRLELLMDMAGAALDGRDPAAAAQLADEAAAVLDGAAWPLEYFIPLTARLAELDGRGGRAETAEARVEKAWQGYQERFEEIIDIYRAGALLPLAEACHRLGEREKALAIYKRALRESVVNVNSRPRAENLCDLCLSLAVSAVEPDAELAEGIRKVREGLGAPW